MSAIAGQAIGAIGGQMMDIMAEKRADHRQKRAEDRSEQRERNMAHMYDQMARDKFEWTGYGAQVDQMKRAGLNTGLMYGTAGQGGQANMNTASSTQSVPSVQNNTAKYMEVGQQAAMMEAQKENIIANTKKTEAEAQNIGEKTTTEVETREILKENMRQSGISTWFDNIIKDFKTGEQFSNDETALNVYSNVVYGKDAAISRESWEIKELNTNIFKTMAETDAKLAEISLTNKKIEYYWNELMNATAHANADMIKAAAMKLSAEWNTGEFTNWKTWADLALKGADAVGNLIKSTTKGVTETVTESLEGETPGGDKRKTQKTTTRRK